MSDNSTAIENIEAIQNEGAASVNVDGVSVTRDFGELRKRKQELIQTDNTLAKQRPRIAAINLGSTF